jgi:DNA-binding NarL/FixJ family response regulator
MVLLLKSLTPRERKVLSLMAKEYSIEYIAEMMNITPNTVKTYRQKIMTKLGVKTGLGLGRFCLLNEYIDA